MISKIFWSEGLNAWNYTTIVQQTCELIQYPVIRAGIQTNPSIQYSSSPLTLCPGGSPGSHTAADSMRTSRSWMKPMLSPTFSSPACSTPSDGTSALRSNPRTFPKQRRNCITIRQSEKHPPGNTRPAIRDSTGRGWTWTKLLSTYNSSQDSLAFEA